MKRGADGKETMEGAGDDDVQNRILRKILNIEDPNTRLTLATVSQYLEDVTSRKGLEDGMIIIANAYRRSDEGGIGVPSTWAGIQPLKTDLMNLATVRMATAESSEKVRTLFKLMERGVPGKILDMLLIAAADDPEVPGNLMLEVCRPLRGRTLQNMKLSDSSKLARVMRNDKETGYKYCRALLSSPCREEIWRPPFESKFAWRNKKKEVVGTQRPGFRLQADSVLGWLLSPTPLDGALMGPSQAHLTEAGSSDWSNIRRFTQQGIDNKSKGLQMSLAGAQKEAAEFVDIMLRAGDETRYAVFEWLGTIMNSAEPRGRQGYTLPDGFNFWPHQGHAVIDAMGNDKLHAFERNFQNLLYLQVLQARIQGFPTSGVALNTFALLMHLTKPIKLETAASISPYFALRKDIEQLLGVWMTDKESRFGDKEEVEAARSLAQADACFTSDPRTKDKRLISTEVFWLASKGIGCLFLPVAKEAFNTFHDIGGHFYKSDPASSDAGWREYLLAKAALHEPTFLENIAHFIQLQFHFLQHAAAGGKAPLPPPAPGPEWHALPSIMLENVLDILDLYRDRENRKKSGQIPTGLFAHMDPVLVLNTLCIFMASDDHVKDPSLRGRAVKLMHRLCFSYQTWQMQLNQPPLKDHLIPCLVGVFSGVEKAIQSYYDLSYRLKYELRLPVMDLFDLALQQKGHQQILVDFATGQGHERFLKLMTQLINDSNSQIGEAMTTLKDFQESKKNPDKPMPAPGQRQHDEEVQDDDNTDGGEDVYRRSRMNYKEHAKKYFGLSSRTWKQLWLLTKHCAKTIIDGQGGTILEQLIHTSLDAQLHFLVGPEMKNIKGTPAEYQELGFDPKDMIRKIAEIFNFLISANRDEVVRVVAKDERYYSGTTFTKAATFLRKYQLMQGEELAQFTAFVKELGTKVQEQREAFDAADIPDEFLCQISADLMSDPVMFPQSKQVVDRNTAWRMLATTPLDPYANTPVRMEEMVAQDELKKKIHEFAKKNGIPLEGGNMFD